MNTSFSALNTFKTCPLKYKFQVVDRIKTKKSPEAVFGTLIHDTMKFIHSGGFTNPSLKEALNHFSTHWNPDVFDDEINERSAFAQGINIIQLYYQKNDPAMAKIVDLESRFVIELEDSESKEKHFISGIIDRIDKTDKGYEIIDYKTSKKMPPQKSIDDNLQLLIYLLAFLKRYPKEESGLGNISLSLYFLRHSAKLSSTKTTEELQKGRKEVMEIIHQIKNSDFPAIMSPLCGWCEHQKICPMWKHKFKEETFDDRQQKKIIEEYLKAQENAKSERRKAAELQQKILEIMEQENVERLFGENKIVAKTHRQTFAYNEDKLKEILEKKDLWDTVVKLNQTQLKKVMETLPLPEKKEIEKTRELARESWGLSIKKNRS
ncbi:MAG: PD-(D/E)XK nuclease family protein [Patescibacteria group bacterium]|nr:PD-(D/E)XK nuclease family protein [Patescibacteria group bacterium]